MRQGRWFIWLLFGLAAVIAADSLHLAGGADPPAPRTDVLGEVLTRDTVAPAVPATVPAMVATTITVATTTTTAAPLGTTVPPVTVATPRTTVSTRAATTTTTTTAAPENATASTWPPYNPPETFMPPQT